MALGFFILGPRTRMSGQIGVPSILGGSQNLGKILDAAFFGIFLRKNARFLR